MQLGYTIWRVAGDEPGLDLDQKKLQINLM
jgi:hypothetical protein